MVGMYRLLPKLAYLTLIYCNFVLVLVIPALGRTYYAQVYIDRLPSGQLIQNIQGNSVFPVNTDVKITIHLTGTRYQRISIQPPDNWAPIDSQNIKLFVPTQSGEIEKWQPLELVEKDFDQGQLRLGRYRGLISVERLIQAEDSVLLPDISTNNETETVSVAFASKSTDLDELASGINQNEIYHYNRQVQNGAETINIIRVSVAESGSSANAESIHPRISTDGNYVVFVSNATDIRPMIADLEPANNFQQIYLWQNGGTNKRISQGTNQNYGDADSELPVVNSDGKFIAFQSQADNLVPLPPPLIPDDLDTIPDQGTSFYQIYLWTDSVGLVRISQNSSQIAGNGNSRNPSISNSGTTVVFASGATNLIEGKTLTTPFEQIYLWTEIGGTICVSQQANQTLANADSESPAISGDGSWVVFVSSATNLVANDTNGYKDVFCYQVSTGQINRVSVASDQIQSNQDCINPSVSSDGRFIVFESTASNLATSAEQELLNVFVHDRQTGITQLVSQSESGTNEGIIARQARISPNGKSIVFASASQDLVTSLSDESNLTGEKESIFLVANPPRPNSDNVTKAVYTATTNNRPSQSNFEISMGDGQIEVTFQLVLDGSGSVAVDKSSVPAGATDQSLRFTYTNQAGEDLKNAKLYLQIPTDWPIPNLDESTELATTLVVSPARDVTARIVTPITHPTETSDLTQTVELNIEKLRPNKSLTIDYSKLTVPNYLGKHHFAFSLSSENQPFGRSIEVETIQVNTTTATAGSGLLSVEAFSTNGSSLGQVISAKTIINKFVFTFTAEGIMDGEQIRIQLPDDWVVPQSYDANSPGFIVAEPAQMIQSISTNGRQIDLLLRWMSAGQNLYLTYANNTISISDSKLLRLGSDFKLWTTGYQQTDQSSNFSESILKNDLLTIQAEDGSGNLASLAKDANTDSTILKAGESGRLELTYTAMGQMNGGRIRLEQPRNWITPTADNFQVISEGLVGNWTFEIEDQENGEIIVPIEELAKNQTIKLIFDPISIVPPVRPLTFNLLTQGSPSGQLISHPTNLSLDVEIDFESLDVEIPAGISLLHIPLQVRFINGTYQPLTKISDLYDVLENTIPGTTDVRFIVTKDLSSQNWKSYPHDLNSNLDLTADRGLLVVRPNAVEAISLKVEGRNWSSSNGVNSQVIILNQGWNLIGLSIKPDTIDSEKILNLPNSMSIPNDLISVVVAGDPWNKPDLNTVPVQGGSAFFIETLEANKLTVSGVDWPLTEGQVLLPYSIPQSSPILQIYGRLRDRSGRVITEMETSSLSYRLINPKLNPTPMAEEPLKIDQAGQFRLTWVHPHTLVRLNDQIERFLIQTSTNGSRVLTSQQLTITEDHLSKLVVNWDIVLAIDSPSQAQVESIKLGRQQALLTIPPTAALMQFKIARQAKISEIPNVGLKSTLQQRLDIEHILEVKITDSTGQDITQLNEQPMEIQIPSEQADTIALVSTDGSRLEFLPTTRVGSMLVSEARHLSYIVTLKNQKPETISQIDDFTGSPYDQDSIIDLGQYFTDPDFNVGDRLTFEVETAEPIGYLYDGTALKWIDTDTINYQHSGTDRFDDLLMTSTFTFIDSGLTIKAKDQQDRISATVSPQTVNQTVEFNFEDGSSLIFMLDQQYLAGDLNGTLTLSRSGLFNNSVVDPNTGKAKLAVKSDGLLKLDFNELVEGSTQLVVKANDIQGESADEIHFRVELNFFRTVDWEPSSINLESNTIQNNIQEPVVKTVTLKNTGQTVLNIKDIYANWSGIDSVELSKYKQQLFSQSMDNQIAVNQSLEIPVNLIPALDLHFSPLPLDGIKLIIEIDKLESIIIPIALKLNQQPSATTLQTEIIWPSDGARMIKIPAGGFQMGDHINNSADQSVHPVEISGFYIDKYEVTNAQYRRFIEDTGYAEPSLWNTLNYANLNQNDQPVVGVSWRDAMAYSNWAGKRLPTEAEWEYAARGGLIGQKYLNSDDISRDEANYQNTEGRDIWTETAKVGQLDENGYGLYDMLGNVAEWCLDTYQEDFYHFSSLKNPVAGSYDIASAVNGYQEVNNDRIMVARGGSWNSTEDDLVISARISLPALTHSSEYGFRCVVRPTTSYVSDQKVEIEATDMEQVGTTINAPKPSRLEMKHDSLAFSNRSQPYYQVGDWIPLVVSLLDTNDNGYQTVVPVSVQLTADNMVLGEPTNGKFIDSNGWKITTVTIPELKDSVQVFYQQTQPGSVQLNANSANWESGGINLSVVSNIAEVVLVPSHGNVRANTTVSVVVITSNGRLDLNGQMQIAGYEFPLVVTHRGNYRCDFEVIEASATTDINANQLALNDGQYPITFKFDHLIGSLNHRDSTEILIKVDNQSPQILSAHLNGNRQQLNNGETSAVMVNAESGLTVEADIGSFVPMEGPHIIQLEAMGQSETYVGQFTIPIQSEIMSGQYPIKIWATDLAGNVSMMTELPIKFDVNNYYEYDLVIPQGLSLVQLPQKVYSINDAEVSLDSLAALYLLLNTDQQLLALIHPESVSNKWQPYQFLGDINKPINPSQGIMIVRSLLAQPITLKVKAIRTEEVSTPITLSHGYNLIGRPSVDSQIDNYVESMEIGKIGSGKLEEISIDWLVGVSSTPIGEAYVIRVNSSGLDRPTIELPIADVGFSFHQVTEPIMSIDVPPVTEYSSVSETCVLIVNGSLFLSGSASAEDFPNLNNHRFEMISQIISSDGKTIRSKPIVNTLNLIKQDSKPIARRIFRFILFDFPVLAQNGDILDLRLVLDNRRIIDQKQIDLTNDHLDNFGLDIEEVQLSSDLFIEDSSVNTVGLDIKVGEDNLTASPLYTVEMEEDQDKIVLLNQIFSDVDDLNGLTFRVESSSSTEIDSTIQPATVNESAKLLLKPVEANWHGNTKITLSAMDSANQTVRAAINVSVKSINDPPISSLLLPDLILDEDQKKVIILKNQDGTSPYFSDADSLWKDKLEFSAEVNQKEEKERQILGYKVRTVDQTDSGVKTVLELTPNPNQHGTVDVTITATDQSGASQDQTFSVTIQPVNDTPEMKQAVSEVEINWNQSTTIDLSAIFIDPDVVTDDDQLTFQVKAENSPVETELIDPELLRLTLVNPFDEESDQFELIIVASDKAGLTASHKLRIKKFTGNHPPTVIEEIEDLLLFEDGSAITFNLDEIFDDSDVKSVSANNTLSDNLRFTSEETNNLLVLTIMGNELKLVPRDDRNGITKVTVTALDMLNAKAETEFEVQIRPVNDPPSLVDQLQLIEMDEDSSGYQFSIAGIFSDPDILTDGDQLRYEVSGNQLLHSVLEEEKLTLIPKTDQYGTTQLSLIAIDQHGSQLVVPIQVRVNPINDPPRVQPKIDLNQVPKRYVGEKIPLDIGLQDLLGENYNPAGQLMILFESDQPSGQFFNQVNQPITALEINQPRVSVSYTDTEPGLSLLTVRVRDLESTKDLFPASVFPIAFESPIIEVQIGGQRWQPESVATPLRLNQEMEIVVIGVPELSGEISLRSRENVTVASIPLAESIMNTGIYKGELIVNPLSDQSMDGMYSLIIELGQGQRIIDSAFSLDTQPPLLLPANVYINGIQQPSNPLVVVTNNQNSSMKVEFEAEIPAEVWVDISALDKKLPRLKKMAKTGQFFSTQLAIDHNTTESSGPKSFRIIAQDLAGNRSELEMMVEFSAYRTLEMIIPTGLSFINLPLEITKINDQPINIKTVGDLFSVIGSNKISHLITYHHRDKVWRSYLGSESKGRLADQPLNPEVGMLVLTRPNIDDIKLKLSGKQRPILPVDLKAGVNLIGIPYNGQFKTLEDLFELEGLKDLPVSIVIGDRGRFRTISAADINTVEDRAVRVGQAFLILAPLSAVADEP